MPRDLADAVPGACPDSSLTRARLVDFVPVASADVVVVVVLLLLRCAEGAMPRRLDGLFCIDISKM